MAIFVLNCTQDVGCGNPATSQNLLGKMISLITKTNRTRFRKRKPNEVAVPEVFKQHRGQKRVRVEEY
jgi:hypothetical protein